MAKRNVLITWLLTLTFALLGVFLFRLSYVRLYETLVDLYNSSAYYISRMFNADIPNVPTVIEYSKALNIDTNIPVDFSKWQELLNTYFTTLTNIDNFQSWLKSALLGLYDFVNITIIILPILAILAILIKAVYKSSNNKYDKDTLPLKAFKKLSRCIYEPIKKVIRTYKSYLHCHRYITRLWIAIWLFNFNLVPIFVEFIAYYLYISVTFDWSSMYIQVAKLLIDLNLTTQHFPWWVIAIEVIVIFNILRRNIAIDRLRHMEAKNCGFINALPIVSMTCGSMGTKKTTAITDMSLSEEVMFRQKALELLQKNDMKFPFFPWISFELEIQACMAHKTVYNLATAKAFVATKRARFHKHKDSDLQLYGYDYERYGTTYDDKLKVSDLFDILSSYAQLYFIYVIESSLIVSNYSIREDNAIMSQGNFPIWNDAFFTNKAMSESRHSHILDFDVLRLGKKVIENNTNIGSFEFGVVTITEVGKERGNNLELKEVKKGVEETNQKNDLFNSWLKMCRHSATVDNFPFIKVFTDEQRPASWGADARDLCDIVTILHSSEHKLALPFYAIENILADSVFRHFTHLYYDFRYRRGDNTLLVHILKILSASIYKHNAKIHNMYGYCKLDISTERGVMEGKKDKKTYFLSDYKIYRSRFSTDCFSDYFNDLAKRTKVGLDDYREYQSERAIIAELKLQNSFFINALYKK